MCLVSVKNIEETIVTKVEKGESKVEMRSEKYLELDRIKTYRSLEGLLLSK